jgi:drug/metabolite transporter (DMT)-like permease
MYKAYALLALTTLFWAGNSIAGKLAVGHVSPMVLVTVRWATVLLALYVFSRKQIAADWAAIRARLPYLLLLGAIGFTGFSVALYYALIYTTAINASIMQGELANLVTLNINFGDALVLVAVVAYGIYTAALRSKPQIHWTSLLFVLCLGATVSSLPLLALEAGQGASQFPDWQGWALIAFIVVFPSLLAQVFYIRAVELIGGNRAGLFVNLLPLWGALLAVTLIGEAFHPYHAVAVLMILAGIGFAEYGGRKLSRRQRQP